MLPSMPKSEEIRKARETAGLSQGAAAEILGVSRETWTRYEIGSREMTESAWAYWKHVAGIERLPFRKRPK